MGQLVVVMHCMQHRFMNIISSIVLQRCDSSVLVSHESLKHSHYLLQYLQGRRSSAGCGNKHEHPGPTRLCAVWLCSNSNPCCTTPSDIDEHEDEEDPLCPEPPQGRRILWDYIILDEGHKVGGL